MQPFSREMQGMNSILNQTQMSLQDLHQNAQNPQIPNPQIQHLDPTSPHDDFLEQMLSSLPSCSWPDIVGTNSKSPWDISSNTMVAAGISSNKSIDMTAPDDQGTSNPDSVLHHQFCFDDDQSSAVLASKLRQQQVSGGCGEGGGGASLSAAKLLLLHQQLMMQARDGGLRSSTVGSDAEESGLLSMPLRLGSGDDVIDVSSFKSSDPGGDVQALYNGFVGSLHGNGQTSNHAHHFQNPQNYGVPTTVMNQVTAASGSARVGGGGAAVQPRPRVRARRGQATDPHSIAERLRRERIAERMKALQELIPNANKTDKASMLDEIIDYVKFLQLQVKVLSMSRLGGAAAVAPLVADMSFEGGGDNVHSSGGGRGLNGTQTAVSTSNNNNNNDSMTVTEHQVAKLMEEDMGSAMQYLQGKGLCLMPISLATAISTATCRSRNPMPSTLNHPLLASNGVAVAGTTTEGVGGGPSSPSLSVLTVQSTTMGNGGGDASSVKDAASVSKS